MSFEIRLATGADSLAAAEVVKAVYKEYGFTWEEGGYHSDLYDLDKYYLSLGDPFWVCLVGGQVVATCGLEYFDLIPEGEGDLVEHEGKRRIAKSDCSLERLYVHPGSRRFGIGAALFETAIETAREAGRTRMEIWSDKEFEDAHRLYERYGAVVVGERICDDPDEAEEWGLALDIKPRL